MKHFYSSCQFSDKIKRVFFLFFELDKERYKGAFLEHKILFLYGCTTVKDRCITERKSTAVLHR